MLTLTLAILLIVSVLLNFIQATVTNAMRASLKFSAYLWGRSYEIIKKQSIKKSDGKSNTKRETGGGIVGSV
jgi:hypothetical protein